MFWLFSFIIFLFLNRNVNSSLVRTTHVPRSQPKIVIVGGGVSGVAAATKLLERGFKNVKILEAENRIGGRVNTVPFGERYVDLGAHWIHGEEGNVVYSIASERNLTYHSGDYKNLEFITDNGDAGPNTLEIFNKIVDEMQDIDSLKAFPGNQYDYLMISGKKILNEYKKDEKFTCSLLNMTAKMGCTAEGCDDLKEVSSTGTAQFKNSPGDFLTSWKDGGYNSIVQILLNNHSTSTEKPIKLDGFVYLNKEVNLIDWSGSKALVNCLDGTVYEADHVIVTVSLGVLKERHSTLFKPPLPNNKVTAIRTLGIGTINKVYLHFPNQWWPSDVNGLIILKECNDTTDMQEKEHGWEKEVFGFFSESSAPNVLSTWFVGTVAKDIENYTDDQILKGVYRVLNKYLGKNYTIPLPDQIIRSKWWSNPHFRGSWSFRSVASQSMNVTSKDLSEPLGNNLNDKILLFAGEATHPHYYSTVHGALETGWREAYRLAQKYM